MTTIKFGDQITVTANPSLVIALSEAFEDWLEALSEEEQNHEINVDRSCLAMAQQIIKLLKEKEDERPSIS